jgi:hypothetical protein
MRNILHVALGVLFLSGAAFAERTRPSSQSHDFLREHNLRVGVDTEVGIPLGNYGDQNSVGAGVLVNGELALLDTISATLRLGYEAHVDRTFGAVNSHVNAIPMLLGAKMWFGAERQGMFGAAELGMFDLMSSVSQGQSSATSNNLRFGLGAGVGYQQGPWNARVSVHSQDVGNFGSAMMISGGIGWQFGSF